MATVDKTGYGKAWRLKVSVTARSLCCSRSSTTLALRRWKVEPGLTPAGQGMSTRSRNWLSSASRSSWLSSVRRTTDSFISSRFQAHISPGSTSNWTASSWRSASTTGRTERRAKAVRLWNAAAAWKVEDRLTGRRSSALVHGHQGRKVGRVVGQDQRRSAALAGGDLQRQVHAAEGDGRQGLAVDVLKQTNQKGITSFHNKRDVSPMDRQPGDEWVYLEDRVGDDDDGPFQDVGQGQHVDLLETLVGGGGSRAGSGSGGRRSFGGVGVAHAGRRRGRRRPRLRAGQFQDVVPLVAPLVFAQVQLQTGLPRNESVFGAVERHPRPAGWKERAPGCESARSATSSVARGRVERAPSSGTSARPCAASAAGRGSPTCLGSVRNQSSKSKANHRRPPTAVDYPKRRRARGNCRRPSSTAATVARSPRPNTSTSSVEWPPAATPTWTCRSVHFPRTGKTPLEGTTTTTWGLN